MPKQIINLACYGQVPLGYRQHLCHIAGGARARTADHSRREPPTFGWSGRRSAAREAKALRAKEGWTLAGNFRHMRAVCV
jgi:hypothetical protein